MPETDTPKALRLRDDFRNGVHDLIAPDVFPVETIHALTRAERQGRVTPAEGSVLFKDLVKNLPLLHPYLPLLPRAYQISSSMRIGVYDCLYVSLAERESCEFVTADHKMIKNLQPTFAFIVSLASIP